MLSKLRRFNDATFSNLYASGQNAFTNIYACSNDPKYPLFFVFAQQLKMGQM